MPRPAKMTADQRGEYVRARLTATELARFDARAAAAGLTRSEYLRKAILSGRVIIKNTAAANPQLIAELNRIAVNLKQLVRIANGIGPVPPELDRLCRIIEAEVLKAIDPEVHRGAVDCQ